MSHADLEDLAALALDPTQEPDQVRGHVSTCPDCSSTLRSLADVRRLAGAEPLVPPPAHVRARVLEHARGDRADDASSRHPVTPIRRGMPLWVVGLAAGVALVAGLGLGRLTGGPAQSPVEPDAGTVVAAADLTALDSDAPRGVASALRRDEVVTLRVRASELGAEPGVHEVWLLNVDGERMVALGFLASGDEGEFDVPVGLIEKGYRIVDISVEPDDGDPTHSGVSLARGELV